MAVATAADEQPRPDGGSMTAGSVLPCSTAPAASLPCAPRWPTASVNVPARWPVTR